MIQDGTMGVDSLAALSRLHEPLFQPQLLVYALSSNLERPLLLSDSGTVVTAGQFRDLTSQYLQAFAAIGLLKGDRIAILSSNRPEVLYVTAACLLGQFVLVPPHPGGSPTDILYMIS